MKDLRKNIQSDLDTGHALNETNWDKPNDGNDDRYEESPPMHSGRISQADPQRHTNHDEEHSCVPPLRYIFVFVHHTKRIGSQHLNACDRKAHQKPQEPLIT